MNLGKSNLKVPRVAIGCMRINSMNIEELAEYIKFCVDNGLNFLTMLISMEEESVKDFLAKL